MDWQRPDRENTLKTIDSVKSVSEAASYQHNPILIAQNQNC